MFDIAEAFILTLFGCLFVRFFLIVLFIVTLAICLSTVRTAFSKAWLKLSLKLTNGVPCIYFYYLTGSTNRKYIPKTICLQSNSTKQLRCFWSLLWFISCTSVTWFCEVIMLCFYFYNVIFDVIVSLKPFVFSQIVQYYTVAFLISVVYSLYLSGMSYN